MAYTNDRGVEVYTPEELGISWGDIWGGVTGAAGKTGEWLKAGAQAELEKRYGGAAPAAPTPGLVLPAEKSFLEKYGLYLALGGGAVILLLVLRKKK